MGGHLDNQQESIVYGCIKDIVDTANSVARRQSNRRAMETLPKSDDWPYLCQEMFSVPKFQIYEDIYQTQVMHFGASYRAIEYEWNLWIKKFEALLEEMYWVSAVVHLETELTGTHTFTWESKGNEHVPGQSMQHMHCQWSIENSLA